MRIIKIEYLNFELIKDYQTLSVPWLENIREPFLNKLIEEFEKYFPQSQLSNLKVFLPSEIPKMREALYAMV